MEIGVGRTVWVVYFFLPRDSYVSVALFCSAGRFPALPRARKRPAITVSFTVALLVARPGTMGVNKKVLGVNTCYKSDLFVCI